MRRLLAALAVMLLAGCGGVKGEPVSAVGSLTIPSSDFASQPRAVCQGTDGFGDINASSAVVLREDDGTFVDRTDLGTGHLVVSDRNIRTCLFAFYLEVQAGGSPDDEFTVEVAHRGEVLFTRREMVHGGIDLQLHS